MGEVVSADSFAFRVTALQKRYVGRAAPALDIDAPFDIRRGEIFVVVGPSGAGKSTLLRALALLETPTRGAFEALGARLDERAKPSLALRRRIVLVFQRHALQGRSAADNVAFGLRARGERDVAGRVARALAQMRLTHLAGAHAKSLSGGEAQRVALARALVVAPDALLLDEPTANLDPFNVGVIEQAIRELNERRGATVVWVTHNVFQARRVAQRVGLMLDGKMVEVADAQPFFESPSDPRTAAFVRGDMVY